ncbi:MAG TPA: hypothetical protein VF756_00230, partial [Thermoanaerobaculia bacterium]
PWAGGSAGDRRLRDLREAGLAIESERFAPGDDAPESASWLWRLGSPHTHGSNQRIKPENDKNADSAPLQGITVRFVPGAVPGAAPSGALDVSPGASSPLAPSFSACEDEAYRRELLQAFHSGRLVSSFAGRKDWSLWADPAAAYDPRPVLRAALSKLGATLGD